MHIFNPYYVQYCGTSSEDPNKLRHISEMFHELVRNYSEKTKISVWTIQDGSSIARELNFPSQPKENGVDCGVLVCFCSWSVITGLSISNIARHDFNKDMRSVRNLIGNYIMKWVAEDTTNAYKLQS